MTPDEGSLQPMDLAATVRLRQAVIATAQIEPLASRLREDLALEEPFRDPGVAAFGLENVVFAIGDCFLEVVAPTAPGTAAARQIERCGGDCGYMVLFDVRDLEGARERAAGAGVRTVWQIDLPDISGTHLHPSDMLGTIVSLDCSRPQGSWRWGGPGWTERIGRGAPGRLTGVTVAVADPIAACGRWAGVLGLTVDPSTPARIELQDQTIRFEARDGGPGGVVAIALQVPGSVRAGRAALELGALRIDLEDLPA